MSRPAPPQQPSQELVGYDRDLQIERERYKNVSNVHDLPPIFHYWSNKYVLPMVLEAGGTAEHHVFAMYAKYLVLSARNSGLRSPAFLSVGAGNCDAEVRIAKLLKGAGLSDFLIECLELNPDMLERGRVLAEEAGMARNLAFIQADFNKWVATQDYAAVIADQSLHHVLDLEHLLDQIKRCLLSDGYFLTNDMIGRNGHLRWPEALWELQRFWRELPVDHRWNHALSRYEELYVNHDCSTEGFEGVRAQDILPLLLTRFDFRVFIGFANVVDVFLDRAFGHNFDIESSWDRDFIDRVQEFDEQAILSGKLSPTHMIAVMTAGPCAEHYYARGLSPANCVRKPAANRELDSVDLAIATPSLQRWQHPEDVPPQMLDATGGVPPYHWAATGLPPDLHVSPAGFLSGRPKRAGLFHVDLTVTDSAPVVRTASQRFTIRIGNILNTLAITSPHALPPGIAGRQHGQKFVAIGGKPPYTWSVTDGALPDALTFGSDTGFLSGVPARAGMWKFRIQVTDSEGIADAIDAVLEILAAEPDAHYSAVLSHVAAGDNWNTSIHLLNPSPSAVPVTVHFRSDDGNPLALPVKVSADGDSGARSVACLNRTVRPYASLTVETALEGGVHRAGWCEVLSSAGITGYATLHYQSPEGVRSDETVPLECGDEQAACLLFDNLDGTRTGVAIANLTPLPASINVTAWDQDWNQLAQCEFVLTAHGHASFLASHRLPETAGHRGVIQFRTATEVRIAGLSLLFPAGGRLLTTPKLPLAGPRR